MGFNLTEESQERELEILAERILELCGGQRLSDELRGRFAKEAGCLGFRSVRLYPGSLEEDPEHRSNYYISVDLLEEGRARPVLVHIAPGSKSVASRFAAVAQSFPARLAGQEEIWIRYFPFTSGDHASIRTFAEQVAPVFLPRPQRALPAVAVGNRHPEISLPAAFDAFRAIKKRMDVNMASTVQLSATREMTTDEALAARDGEIPTAAGHTRVSIRHLYHAGLWAAIRSGWREGYTAEADHFIVTGNSPEEIARSVETVKEAIRHAVGYTKFTTDTSRLIELQADPRHPQAWSDAVVAEKWSQIFSNEERHWMLSEFPRAFAIEGCSHAFTREEITRLAVKFGESLKLNEELHDSIRAEKVRAGCSPEFDFEPSLDEAETLTTAKELLFYMHWLKARGRPAQLVPPNLGFKKRQAYPEAMQSAGAIGLADYCHHKMWDELPRRTAEEFHSQPLAELAARIAELAAVARYFDGTLSIHSGSGKQAAVLELIGQATAGRVNYKISGELQLQLFDVLSEQPEDSPWKQLYARMAERTNQFAAAGAYGAESELAGHYLKMGRGNYLGKSELGRVDGNLFLVFWLGNIVGSRDVDSPDGDCRFFKEKLDELPEDLVQEVRRRNTRYIVWLAEHLRP
ncbi:MAG: tagaturonate epimerase family protein [Acidobacteriia bacterium]|nr:tagaturonate epimerase family protein [Terriglobia bacterium]